LIDRNNVIKFALLVRPVPYLLFGGAPCLRGKRAKLRCSRKNWRNGEGSHSDSSSYSCVLVDLATASIIFELAHVFLYLPFLHSTIFSLVERFFSSMPSLSRISRDTCFLPLYKGTILRTRIKSTCSYIKKTLGAPPRNTT
jgi:hypothetical protein